MLGFLGQLLAAAGRSPQSMPCLYRPSSQIFTSHAPKPNKPAGLADKWKAAGFKWVCFFQDTNALVFRALPAAIGA